MKRGEEIKGYRVITSPTNSGGGMCVWAFAAMGGREYFIKEFLSPKFPLPSSMGSEASKAARRAECAEFESRHREVMKRLKNATTTPGGGNLVTAIEFFRNGTFYYKVTDRIEIASLASLDDLSTRERAVIFRTLVLSLQMLHRKNIVHGDLKPANVLIQRVPESRLYTAKLIDFDDSYLDRTPPSRDQIVGDSIYAAPEWFGYTMGDELVTPEMLTKASDVFSLGLVFHHYLTDELPSYDRTRFTAPGLAVYARQRLVPDPRLNSRFSALLASMTAANPTDRPAVDEVFNELKHETLFSLTPPTEHPVGTGSRVMFNMAGGKGSVKDTAGSADPKDAPPASVAPRGSRVRYNMATRKEDTKER